LAEFGRKTTVGLLAAIWGKTTRIAGCDPGSTPNTLPSRDTWVSQDRFG
jgi:hypothetical protein